MDNTNANTSKKPLDKPLIITIIVVIVLVIAAIVGLIVVKNLAPKPAETEETAEIEEEEVIVEGDTSTEATGPTENKVSDNATIADLIKKTWILLGVFNASDDGVYSFSSTNRSQSTTAEYQTTDPLVALTDSEKLVTALTYLALIAPDKTNLTLPASEVEKVYQQLFNATPSHQSVDGSACTGHFEYNAEQKVYTRDAYGCGGTLQDGNHYYLYDFTNLDDKTYVYIAAGSTSFNPAGEGQYLQTVYNDVTGNAERGAMKTSEPGSAVITADNYTDFAKYRLIFEKSSDGNYYYVGAEEVL